MKTGNTVQKSPTLRLGLALAMGLALLISVLLAIGTVHPKLALAQGPATRYVDGASGGDNGPCTNKSAPCATIGYALRQAGEGDTILVAEGTYTENLIITKTVTLKGGYEPVNWSRSLRRHTTTIDGNGNGRVIYIQTTLSETTLIEGFTVTNGDGGISTLLSSVTFQNTRVVRNHATGSNSGGGMRIDHSEVTIINTVVADNTSAYEDGALRIVSTASIPGDPSRVSINSSTIVNNSASGRNGIFCSLSSCNIANSIVWGHEGEDLYNAGATYSNIEMGHPGEGNISEDPRFVDSANGDYHLRPDSPCIDTGTNEGAPDIDLEAVPRPMDGDQDGSAITDMGAYERWSHRNYLPIILKGWARPSTWASNESQCTTCAEEDNINIPMFSRQTHHFKVVATQPTYVVGEDNCDPDFSGCESGGGNPSPQDDSCAKLETYPDVEVCIVENWWRPYSMTVVAGDAELEGHYLRWYRTIAGDSSAPQFFVLYEDGNTRIKPHPPVGVSDTCFGSSVIIGPAPLTERPYVDIQEVIIDQAESSLDITYRDGGSAHLKLSVNRDQAVAEVWTNYDSSQPFATFRSMYVSDGNADADHITTEAGTFPFVSGALGACSREWTMLRGPSWLFHRAVRSQHNTSAPDILVEVVN